MLRRALACIVGLMLAAVPARAAISDGALENAPMKLNCAAALLLEPESGQIIFEINADEKRPVASVTKIMTILLACEAIEGGAIDLAENVTVSRNAAGMGGSQVLLDAGESQPVGELLKSVIVGSANDSAVALAEHIAGSAALFVDRMNERASELGMASTNFVNCTGLPAENQHTTARDVARMAAALSKYDLFYDYSSIWLEDFVHESGRVTALTNTNKLLRLYDGCDGIKTGSTGEAGYCMAASAKRGGMRLIAVVLGAPTGRERFDIAEAMLDYGFAGYRLYPVAERGAAVRGKMPVRGGSADGVSLVLNQDLTLLVKKGEERGLSLEAELPEAIDAPVRTGDVVGYVRVLRGGEAIARVPVAAAESVSARSLGNGLARVIRKWCFQA